jgi:dTDP-4-dehydrorhamnose reductase
MSIVGVTGYRGRLGKYLIENLGYVPLKCDVTDPDEVKREMELVQPDTIIHCAAVTDVDGCEGSLYEDALKINVHGVTNIRHAFEGQVIYISTDYVFDGIDGPYNEEAYPSPICHYGLTKSMGEEVIHEWDYPTDVILRTTILYGGHKSDFVTAILDRLKKNEQFPVVGNLIGSPTYVPHLAEGIKKLVSLARPPRIVNISGSDCISRWTFASMIAKTFDYQVYNILMTMRNNGAAKRPKMAGLKLDLARTLNIPIFSAWDGLEEMKNERQKEIG